jgi:DNA-directed RNA polymerase sigma subunit (sigma70/sigma32)
MSDLLGLSSRLGTNHRGNMLQISNPEWIAHRFVLAHQPLARKIARGYAAGGLSFDDLVSAANVGLLEASSRFDEDRGCSFGVYATP